MAKRPPAMEPSIFDRTLLLVDAVDAGELGLADPRMGRHEPSDPLRSAEPSPVSGDGASSSAGRAP